MAEVLAMTLMASRVTITKGSQNPHLMLVRKMVVQTFIGIKLGRMRLLTHSIADVKVCLGLLHPTSLQMIRAMYERPYF